MNRRGLLIIFKRLFGWGVALSLVWPALSFVTWRKKRTRTVIFAPEEQVGRAFKDGIILVSESKGWRALSARCTHLCCLVAYDERIGAFRCPCHRSEFNERGEPVRGPAKRPLEWLEVKRLDNGSLAVEAPIMET